jgi:subtilisin-like proprotein convertase family protein
MKIRILLTALMVAMWTSAHASLAYDFNSGTLNAAIPDANAVGINFTTILAGDAGNISDVNVTLDINSAPGFTGYNGDLYGYIISPTGTRVELFNRPGPGVAGNSGSTFSIILSDGGLNLEDTGYAAGDISGTFAPSGTLSSFNNENANGTWRLFLADMSGGNVSQLVSWGLQIEVVPEPTTYALIVFGLVIGANSIARILKSKKALIC